MWIIFTGKYCSPKTFVFFSALLKNKQYVNDNFWLSSRSRKTRLRFTSMTLLNSLIFSTSVKNKGYLTETFPFFPVRENLIKVLLHFAPFEFVPFQENFETESIMRVKNWDGFTRKPNVTRMKSIFPALEN